MSKVLYFLKRNGKINNEEIETLKSIPDRLVPDNINKEKIIHNTKISENLAFLIVNDMEMFQVSGNSMVCGIGDFKGDSWKVPGNPLPSGDLAIFRDEDYIFEVESNSVASRCVWYFFDNDFFIASTSQRALIMMLGDFSFNPCVIPWVLSTGSLGPTFSWDERISRLQPSSRLTLDKESWSICLKSEKVEFKPSFDRNTSRSRLSSEIENSVSSLNDSLNGCKDWVLPLSGGYDSRAILCYLSKNHLNLDKVKTLTWGHSNEENRKYGDAYVAKKLADEMDVTHEYLKTNLSEELIEDILERYLKCSEGRIDHFAGYADGLEIWKRLFKSGIKILVRGDEGFGWVPVTSESSVRIKVGCGLCSDYENLKNLQEKYNLPTQNIPKELEIKEKESLEQWRDRLYHSYRIPTILSALSDIKYSYVEQVNPLIYDNIVRVVRSMPDDLREDKFLFKEIVDSISPKIEYASVGSSTLLNELLSNPRISGYIREYLIKNKKNNIINEKLISEIVEEIDNVKNKKQRYFANALKNRVLSRWLKLKKNTIEKPKVSPYLVAFRVYILLRMNKMLREDATH